MELFKHTNYDFLGKKWPFIIASLILTVAGLGSIAVRGGLNYGIDFTGGAEMEVKFAQQPDIEKIRSAFSKSPQIKGGVTVTTLTAPTIQNEVEVGTELQDEKQQAVSRSAMESVLSSTYGQPPNGKLDLNNTGKDALATKLADPLAAANIPMSQPQVQTLAGNILDFSSKQYSGLIVNFSQLSGVQGVTPQILNVIKDQTYLSPYAIKGFAMVGPKVGAELRQKAILATLYALAGMLAYIAFRFEWIYGVGAVIAVFHDTIITIGLFSIFGEQISMTVIAALLTLVGYSMNDTIVIFDRIRENLKMSRREPMERVMNTAVNQTLSRTVMTSGLTFITAVALFIFGGPVLHGFSFALVCGIIVGTYSSVFIASPIVLFWHGYADRRSNPAAAPSVATRVEGPKKPPVKSLK